MQRSSRFGLILSVLLLAAASAAHFAASHSPINAVTAPQAAPLSGPLPFDRVTLGHSKERDDDASQGDLRSLHHGHD